MKKIEEKRKELLKAMIDNGNLGEGLNFETTRLLKKINKIKKNYDRCIEDVNDTLKRLGITDEFIK